MRERAETPEPGTASGAATADSIERSMVSHPNAIGSILGRGSAGRGGAKLSGLDPSILELARELASIFRASVAEYRRQRLSMGASDDTDAKDPSPKVSE